ncbi:MAG: hypothetical protein H7Z10_12440 [Gemmatimonadaceae bacterium]|nr:hypothetical protein [Acetobacteraceae bacterium]
MDAVAGDVTAELARRGIPADARVRVQVDLIDDPLPLAAMAQAGGAFDWLSNEPDLYSDADLVRRIR